MRDNKKHEKRDSSGSAETTEAAEEWLTSREVYERTHYSTAWVHMQHKLGRVRRIEIPKNERTSSRDGRFRYNMTDVQGLVVPRRTAVNRQCRASLRRNRLAERLGDRKRLNSGEAVILFGIPSAELVSLRERGKLKFTQGRSGTFWYQKRDLCAALGREPLIGEITAPAPAPKQPRPSVEATPPRAAKLQGRIDDARVAIKWAIEGRRRNYFTEQECNDKIEQFTEQL